MSNIHRGTKSIKRKRKIIDTQLVINIGKSNDPKIPHTIIIDDARYVQIIVRDSNGRDREVFKGHKFTEENWVNRPYYHGTNSVVHKL